MTGFIGKIETLCSACELVYDQTHENSVRMMFEMDDDRSQMVIINGVETNDGNEVVTIQSAVLKLEGLPNQMLGGDMAKKLLRENSQMALAKWSIDETQDGKQPSCHLKLVFGDPGCGRILPRSARGCRGRR
jgi:hypothetical protein